MTVFCLYQVPKKVKKEPKIDAKPEINDLDIRIFDKYDCTKAQKLSKKQGKLLHDLFYIFHNITIYF